MWREEVIWNVSVLQRVHLSNLVLVHAGSKPTLGLHEAEVKDHKNVTKRLIVRK
jgi:hypothetical protein